MAKLTLNVSDDGHKALGYEFGRVLLVENLPASSRALRSAKASIIKQLDHDIALSKKAEAEMKKREKERLKQQLEACGDDDE